MLTYPDRVVGPRGPFQLADLDVKREVFDADVTAGLVDAVGQPGDGTDVAHQDIGVDHGRVVVGVGAESKKGRHSTQQKCDEECLKGTFAPFVNKALSVYLATPSPSPVPFAPSSPTFPGKDLLWGSL